MERCDKFPLDFFANIIACSSPTCCFGGCCRREHKFILLRCLTVATSACVHEGGVVGKLSQMVFSDLIPVNKNPWEDDDDG